MRNLFLQFFFTGTASIKGLYHGGTTNAITILPKKVARTDRNYKSVKHDFYIYHSHVTIFYDIRR